MSERITVGHWQKGFFSWISKCYLWKQFKREVSCRTHWPAPLHASLIICVCPHCSLYFRYFFFPYQSLFYIHFLKAASGQNSNRKPQQRPQLDFRHRCESNGRVLFSCLKQSAVILLPWRQIEVKSFVPLPWPKKTKTCQPQTLSYIARS